jgi:FkbM family methyltransferase
MFYIIKMLIPTEVLYRKYNLKINGILHIGAHTCEELRSYNNVGVSAENIIWIEADPKVVERIKHIPNVFNSVISDVDDKEMEFMITNNEESSSLLNLKEHMKYYPEIIEINRLKVKTVTVDTFYQRNNLDPTKYNFVNMDIQGAELMALKGMTQSLPFVNYLYLEVNIRELYEGCGLMYQIDEFLATYGFERRELSLTNDGWGDAFYIKK